MNLFDLNDGQLRALESRCNDVCVVYRDHPLPVGTQPARGRIGVERLDAESIGLHLGSGHSYTGISLLASRLTTDGTIAFPSLGDLLGWLRSMCPAPTPIAPAPRVVSRTPAQEQEPHDPTRTRDADAPEDTRRCAGPRGPEPAVPADQGRGVDEDDLRRILERHVIDQEHAVATISRLLAVHTAKSAPRGPLTVLSVGPTGVGKTFLAEAAAAALAELSDGDWAYFRIDLSEFSERHRVSSLLGAPPGYVGHGATPPLVSHLETNPRSVIVLDEIDKAHPDILVALMNTLDVGRLTPASGDTALDVRHCVFIATSNLATDEMAFLAIDNPDIDPAARLRELLVSAGMRSELINRFDEVIPFRQISHSAQAALIIHSIRRAAGEFGIELTRIDPSVAMLVRDAMPVSDGFGARAIQRVVNELVSPALARGSGTELHLVDGQPARSTSPEPTVP